MRNGNETLENQLINAEQELEEGQRKSKYEIQQLEKELQRVTREYEAADETLGDTVDELGKCRARIQQQEKQYTELKLEYDHLKLQAGDLKDVERISKELSDQISLVHSLENQMRKRTLKSRNYSNLNIYVMSMHRKRARCKLSLRPWTICEIR